MQRKQIWKYERISQNRYTNLNNDDVDPNVRWAEQKLQTAEAATFIKTRLLCCRVVSVKNQALYA